MTDFLLSSHDFSLVHRYVVMRTLIDIKGEYVINKVSESRKKVGVSSDTILILISKQMCVIAVSKCTFKKTKNK